MLSSDTTQGHHTWGTRRLGKSGVGRKLQPQGIVSSKEDINIEQGHHLRCSSHSQRPVPHAHAIQPFACHICNITITIHNKAVPAARNSHQTDTETETETETETCGTCLMQHGGHISSKAICSVMPSVHTTKVHLHISSDMKLKSRHT